MAAWSDSHSCMPEVQSAARSREVAARQCSPASGHGRLGADQSRSFSHAVLRKALEMDSGTLAYRHSRSCRCPFLQGRGLGKRRSRCPEGRDSGSFRVRHRRTR